MDSLPDGFFILPPEFSEFSDLRAACFSGFFRYGPDASCRNRGSKHHAVTVHNLTALRGHRKRAGVTRLTLLLQKLRVNAALQPEGLADNSGETAEKEEKQQFASSRRNRHQKHRLFAAVGVLLFGRIVFLPDELHLAAEPLPEADEKDGHSHLRTSRCLWASSSGETSRSTVAARSAGAKPI